MMKKAISYIPLIILTILSLAACTRNHGDIGPWFGTWHVESITSDGSPEPVDSDYFFQFQSKVFRVSMVYGHEEVVESFGTWVENDGRLIISFPDPSVYYIEMTGLEAHNDFTVTTTSSREVTFTKTDATGSTIAYQLKKQP